MNPREQNIARLKAQLNLNSMLLYELRIERNVLIANAKRIAPPNTSWSVRGAGPRIEYSRQRTISWLDAAGVAAISLMTIRNNNMKVRGKTEGPVVMEHASAS